METTENMTQVQAFLAAAAAIARIPVGEWMTETDSTDDPFARLDEVRAIETTFRTLADQVYGYGCYLGSTSA